MNPSWKLIPSLFALLLLTACASSPTSRSPFLVNQEDFLHSTRTVALISTEFAHALERDSTNGGSAEFNSRLEEARKSFESAVASTLTEAGFSVIPSEEYKQVWDQLIREQGGFFDPATGKRNEAKYMAVRKQAAQFLAANKAADVVLDLRLLPMSIRFSGGVARWDGTAQKIDGALDRLEGASGFFKGMFSSGANTYGSATGASVKMVIADAQTGIETFSNRGGIQLLVKQEGFGPMGMFRSMHLAPIPSSEMFASAERNTYAVAYALDPIVKIKKGL